MSFINFGMSFVLKGLHNPKLAKQLAKRALLDGVFQIHLENRRFVWYDARGLEENKYILEMLFNGSFPYPHFALKQSNCSLIFAKCELHAQSEAEREIVHRILQSIVKKATPSIEDKLQDKSVHKQATVKKKGKVMASKRVIICAEYLEALCFRLLQRKLQPGCTVVSQYVISKGDIDTRRYHILMHHKVGIHPRKQKSLQIVGTYKNLWVAFKTPGERDSWLSELKSTQLPAPFQQIIYEPPMFEPMIQYTADPKKRKYIPAAIPSIARAGPSPD